MLDPNDTEELVHKIDVEGFDYCFRFYSTFQDIHDEKFHELREAYIEAADALDKYINGEIDYE